MRNDGFTQIPNKIYSIGIKGNDLLLCIWILSHEENYTINVNKIVNALGFKRETVVSMLNRVVGKLEKQKDNSELELELYKKLSKIEYPKLDKKLSKIGQPKQPKSDSQVSKNGYYSQTETIQKRTNEYPKTDNGVSEIGYSMSQNRIKNYPKSASIEYYENTIKNINENTIENTRNDFVQKTREDFFTLKKNGVKRPSEALEVRKKEVSPTPTKKSTLSGEQKIALFQEQVKDKGCLFLAMPEIKGDKALLNDYLSVFTNYLSNKKGEYKDYYRAFLTCIRADWGNLRKQRLFAQKYGANKDERVKTFEELEQERIAREEEQIRSKYSTPKNPISTHGEGRC